MTDNKVGRPAKKAGEGKARNIAIAHKKIRAQTRKHLEPAVQAIADLLYDKEATTSQRAGAGVNMIKLAAMAETYLEKEVKAADRDKKKEDASLEDDVVEDFTAPLVLLKAK